MHKKRQISGLFTAGTTLLVFLAMILALASSATPAAAVAVNFDLYAVSGSMAVPGLASVNVWGYNNTNAAVTQPGGPTLVVNQGDSVTVTLHNQLGVDTGILFQGQDMIPDTIGAAPTGTKAYTFTATRPGTYLYEAGLLPGAQYQPAMGLYGALIVKPATAGQAYNDATTAYDDEAVLVLSEIDPALNNSASPAAFDMRDYAPQYFLINGQPYPDTPAIPTFAGNRTLLRYLNAGMQYHSMAVLGMHQTFIADDGNPLLFSHSKVAETIAPGQTMDAIALIPASAADGSQFAIYDGSMLLHNSNQAGFGGMMTFLTVGMPPPTIPVMSFSTVGNVEIPGVPALSPPAIGYDNADIYSWDGTAFSRVFDANSGGGTPLPGSASIDGLDLIDATHFYLSFAGLTTTLPGIGAVEDEDVVYYDNGTWSVYFDGTAQGLTANTQDLDAINIVGNTLYFSTTGNGSVPGVSSPFDNADIYSWDGTAFSRVFDANSGGGTPLPGAANVDGVVMVDATHFYLSFASLTATVPGIGDVEDEDVVYYDGTNWSVYFDGTAQGLTADAQDLNAFSFVITTPPSESTGPITSNLAYSAGTLTGTVDDTTTGGSTVTGAEYYLDSTAGTGTAMDPSDGTFDSVSENVTAAVVLPSGSHTLYVRGQDSLGNWGAFSSLLVNGGDASGPATTGLTLAPNPTNGTADVSLHATGDDSATGNSNIVAAEYTIDGGTAQALTVNLPAPIASLDGTIPAADVNALAEGSHTVAVRSQDADSNWGAETTIDLIVDKTGPDTSNVTADPNPSNGTIGVNTGVPAVRITADFADPLTGGVQSNLSAAEGFIDTVGADGTGFVFAASDGAFDSLGEPGYGDIPLATVLQLSDGEHTIYVHGKDAAGNWGPTSTTTLVVDKTAPSVSGVAVDPNPTDGAASVNLTASATDTGTGVTAAEWFTGADPGTGNGTAMTVSGTGPWDLSAAVDVSTWADGSYTLYVRAKDAAGNWSATGSVSLTVSTTSSATGLYFSTATNSTVPGVAGPFDDADIYSWDGAAFSRVFDASAVGLPGGADIDALLVVDADTFFISFNSNGGTTVPGLGSVQDSSVVLYDAGTWSLFFDGSDVGLSSAGPEDIDAFEILPDNSVLISTIGNGNVPDVGGFNDEDLLRCVGTFGDTTTCTWSVYFDGSDVALTAFTEGVDGAAVSGNGIYLSTIGDFSVTGLSGQNVDVFSCDSATTGTATACGSFSMFFDGSVQGVTDNLDAIDLP